ncbi:MAG: type I 3-dehydroquinate dehydratase [Nitrososphaeraceae archaeon]|jgi:3-dehydroquinate dehydratase-1
MMKICASITEIESKEFHKTAIRAFDLGASFLEIRFDYIEASRLSEAIEIVRPFRAKCIYTLRRTSQGGKFFGSEIERLNLLKDLASQAPMMIDVEFETLQENPEIVSFINSVNVPMLVSWHDFRSTPSTKELSECLVLMSSYSKNNKLVTMANSLDDTLRVLNLYETVDKSLNLVAFSMGEIGLVSRLLCALQTNCPFTYAALDHPVAPGQFTIEQMKKLHSIVEKHNLLHRGVTR